MAIFLRSAKDWAPTQATVALMSFITCASVAAETMRRIDAKSVSGAGSPWRAKKSVAMATYPSLARRRQTSRMYSWIPNTSETTTTTGNRPLASGRAT